MYRGLPHLGNLPAVLRNAFCLEGRTGDLQQRERLAVAVSLHDEDVRRNAKPLRQRCYLANVELPFSIEHG